MTMRPDVVSLLLLLAVAAQGANTDPSPPIAVSYRDISLKVYDDDPSSPYRWFHGRTATQVERDAMEETLVGVAIPDAFRYAALSCGGIPAAAVSQLGKITSKLGPQYEGNALLPGGRWFVPLSGRHYHDEQYALKAVQACALGSHCTTQPGMTPPLMDLLDIREDRGNCLRGADFVLPTPTEAYDAQRAGVGVVTSVGRRPQLTAAQRALLHATHAAHAAVSDMRCGGPLTPTGAVATAHLALEASGRDETEHHFLRMKDFSGIVDPRWSPGDVCFWARLQDRYHEAWMRAVEAGDWGHSREAENDHQLAHLCMNILDERLLVRFSCSKTINACPVASCQAVRSDHDGDAPDDGGEGPIGDDP